MRSALERAKQLSEWDWRQLETDREPPVVELVLSEEEAVEGSEANVIEYVRGVRYAYALLRADLTEAEGTFIAPIWLKDLPELAAADITQDWREAVSGVCGEETEAIYAWLARRGRPSNVVDFFSERDKRRRAPSSEPDIDK